jgi:signal transduction histidine kinase
MVIIARVSDDWLTNWRASIALKITAAVLYVVVFVSFAVAVFALRNIEEKLGTEYATQADLFSFRIQKDLESITDFSVSAVETMVRTHFLSSHASAVAVTVDQQRILVGSPPDSAFVLMRTTHVDDPELKTARRVVALEMFFPPLHDTAKTRRNRFLIATGLATLLFGVFLTWVIRLFIARPFQTLVNATKAISGGDLALRLDPRREDEFGYLAGFFNQMLDQITKELSERKQAEERSGRYATELKENNKELRTFAYIASHDLRTPLVNMKGFAGELRYALQEITSVMNDILPSVGENNRTRLLTAFLKDVPEAIGFIDSSANRMEELINAISTLSRLGRQELKPELIQVQTIVQSALKDLQLVIEKKGIKVNVGPLPEIVADRNALQTILCNILDNAVKYLRPGVPGEIEITAEKAPDGTVISIRDNGRGIPNDEIYKVFEMFRRVGEQDTPGEGVGLACVKTLVRRHGGRIWCESIPGTGTTFHFTIPENAGNPNQAHV